MTYEKEFPMFFKKITDILIIIVAIVCFIFLIIFILSWRKNRKNLF